MAFVRIWQYNDFAYGRAGEYTGLLQEPSLNTINGIAPTDVTIGNTSTDSALFRADCHFIQVQSTADFRYEINRYNTNREAGDNSRKILSGVLTTLAVEPGGYLSVSVLDPYGGNIAFNNTRNSALLVLIGQG